MFFSTAHQQRKSVQRSILRIVNRGRPDDFADDDRPRADTRVHLAAPAWVVPLSGGKPAIPQAFVTVTKEFSATGLSLAVNRPVDGETLFIGLLVEGDPTFFRGQVRHVDPLGAGLTTLGVELIEVLDLRSFPELQALRF